MNELDWVERTRRAVPVLVMAVALVGFAAAMVKWLVLAQPQPALMGICGIAASGGYIWQVALLARRPMTDPPPELPPAPPAPVVSGDSES
jgi:hypothetical protein